MATPLFMNEAREVPPFPPVRLRNPAGISSATLAGRNAAFKAQRNAAFKAQRFPVVGRKLGDVTTLADTSIVDLIEEALAGPAESR